MKNLFIKIFVLSYFFLWVIIFAFVPNEVAAQTTRDRLKRCWTAEQCVGPGGLDGSCTNNKDQTNYCFKLDSDYCGAENLGRCYIKPNEIKLQVAIPSLSGGTELTKASSFPVYLKSIYSFFISVIGIVAVAYIAFGGYQWIVAAGNAEQISRAKNTIQGAIVGLLLAAGSYVILNLINERLVNIDELRVDRIKPIVLSIFCTDDLLQGINDWVLEGDQNLETKSGTDAVCGKNYFRKSNPNQVCRGVSCVGDSGGEYCIPQENLDTMKCDSKAGAKSYCKSQEDIDKNSSACMQVESLFAQQGIPVVCGLYFDNWDFAIWNSPMPADGLGQVIYIVREGIKIINLFTGTFETNPWECGAFDLTISPHKESGSDLYASDRIDCQDGEPLCYDSETNRHMKGCVDMSSFPRVGVGYNRMCLAIEKNFRNIYTCSANKPGTTSACTTLDITYCDWKQVNPPTTCGAGCNTKCWQLIGLFSNNGP